MATMIRRHAKWTAVLTVVAIIALQPGCKSKAKKPPATVIAPTPLVSVGVGGEAGAPTMLREQDILASKDRCAGRLHDMAGAMLFYYALHKQLPAKLEELRGVADVDQQLDFTCSQTGEPYVYNPQGLEFAGRQERLVVYDAKPVHGGSRWGILAARPRGRDPAAMWVVRLPESIFLQYRAALVPADDPPAPPAK